MNTVSCNSCQTPIKSCPNHRHREWEIILHLTGDATAYINDKKYSITPGTVMVIPPKTMHYNCSENFYTDMFLRVKSLDFNGVVILQDTEGEIFTLMNMLKKVLIEKDENFEYISDSIVDLISLYIKKISKTVPHRIFLSLLKNAIYNNYANANFNLSEEIEKIGYNPDYIRRKFKNAFGVTPFEYLTKLRINHAKSLLLQYTFISIETVSSNCGFNDSYYFSTCFKKHTGLSPLQYRKKHLKHDNNPLLI
jgi:AraC-like DNA-binding protein